MSRLTDAEGNRQPGEFLPHEVIDFNAFCAAHARAQRAARWRWLPLWLRRLAGLA